MEVVLATTAMDFRGYFLNTVVNNVESSLLGNIETETDDQHDLNCIEKSWVLVYRNYHKTSCSVAIKHNNLRLYFSHTLHTKYIPSIDHGNKSPITFLKHNIFLTINLNL